MASKIFNLYLLYAKRIINRIRRRYHIVKLSNVNSDNGCVSKKITELFTALPEECVKNSELSQIYLLGQYYNLKNVDWCRDPHSSYIYPKLRFDKIHYENLFNQGIEVKNPWELSRFQFSHKYVNQYISSGNEQYYEDYKKIVYNWCEENPFLYGINWSCTMEVAIRAINWIFACSLFNTIFYEDIPFQKFLKNRLIEHARYIQSFPEIGLNGVSNNHLIADYCGLFVISFFIDSKDCQRWRREAITGLEVCIINQVLDDGCDFECSIPYHRLALEMFLTAALIDADRKLFSKTYYIKLFKMLKFVEQYSDRKGNAPQMGDNDSGIILPFNTLDNQNHLYLLSLGSYIFDYDFLQEKVKNKSLRYLPQKQVKVKQHIAPGKFSNYSSFVNGGYYIIKCEELELVIYSPDYPVKGHGHYDRGNFTLSYKGQPLIVDPGSGCYTSNIYLKNELRSVLSHNVYHCATDKELPLDIFGVSDTKYTSFVEQICDNEATIKIRYNSKDLLSRNFFVKKDELIISDCFLSDASGFTGILNFYEKLVINEDKQICSSNVKIEIKNAYSFKISDYLYSPIYGVTEKKQRLEYAPSMYTKIHIHV